MKIWILMQNNNVPTEDQCPSSLQVLCRGVVRNCMREAHLSRNPHLREPPHTSPKAGNSCPTRICIPIEDDSDVGELMLFDNIHDISNVAFEPDPTVNIYIHRNFVLPGKL